MFSTDCKRMSAEIFDQTMPLGKHWRVGLRPGVLGCHGGRGSAMSYAMVAWAVL